MEILRILKPLAIVGLLIPALAADPAVAQQIRPGQIVDASTSDSKPASFPFTAESAGVLTVVVRASSENDLVLMVTDSDGQPLPEGRSDQDLGGDRGAEQSAVTLPRAGTYMVRVEPFGGGMVRFRMGASWLPFPDLEIPADPDGSPSGARQLPAEQTRIDDSIDGSQGDYWDWFVVTANRAGTLTVATRADEGDLVLEAFEEGEYSTAMERSDQDLQEVLGNEAITLAVQPEQKIYFKVSPVSDGQAVSYRFQIGFIPD